MGTAGGRATVVVVVGGSVVEVDADVVGSLAVVVAGAAPSPGDEHAASRLMPTSTDSARPETT
jgi:hypothetical protein